VGQIDGARTMSRAKAHLTLATRPATPNSESLRVSEYAAATALFAASRLIIFFAILFSVRFIAPNHLPGATNEGSGIWQYLLRWDSGWYLAIMHGGYHYLPHSSAQQTVAFFPLYPVLSWSVAKIFQSQFSTSALLVSNAASIAAVLLLYQYTREHYGKRAAYGAVALFSFFPASIFLSAGYTESLAIALTIAAFLDLRHARYIRASFWCGLLTATRPTGIVMLAPLTYCMWPRPVWTRAAVIRLLFCLGIGCSGLGAFVVYLSLKFNAPFAFATSQNAWNPRAHWSLTSGLYAFTSLANLFRGFPLQSSLDPWIFVGFAALIFAMRSQLSAAELIYSGISFLFLVATRLSDGHAFAGMGRYMMVVFPAYIAAATLLGKRPWLSAGLCLWMAMGLFWYSALFAQWHWVD
jgi:hypothetical protein